MAYPGQPTGPPATQWQPEQGGQQRQWGNPPGLPGQPQQWAGAPGQHMSQPPGLPQHGQGGQQQQWAGAPGQQLSQPPGLPQHGQGGQQQQWAGPPGQQLSQPPGLPQPGQGGQPGQWANAPGKQQPGQGGQPQQPGQQYSSVDVTEDQAREALLHYVAEQSCWGSSAAKDMQIECIVPTSALHYELETFTEHRSKGGSYVPYSGRGTVDGPSNGTPPDIWDMPCEPGPMFQNLTREFEIPHTAYVKKCNNCGASGYVKCWVCDGRGRRECTQCHGSGNTFRSDPQNQGQKIKETCSGCQGNGHKKCYTCGGDGRVRCSTCSGHCNLKHFTKLTVNYANHKSDYILEKSGLPQYLIQNVSGVKVFEQTLPHVWPIADYPVREITGISANIIDKHKQDYSKEKQLQQRQRLRAVPVSEVQYKWKDTTDSFWVYGIEHRVYAPKYPQTSCFGCTVL